MKIFILIFFVVHTCLAYTKISQSPEVLIEKALSRSASEVNRALKNAQKAVDTLVPYARYLIRSNGHWGKMLGPLLDETVDDLLAAIKKLEKIPQAKEVAPLLTEAATAFREMINNFDKHGIAKETSLTYIGLHVYNDMMEFLSVYGNSYSGNVKEIQMKELLLELPNTPLVSTAVMQELFINYGQIYFVAKQLLTFKDLFLCTYQYYPSLIPGAFQAFMKLVAERTYFEVYNFTKNRKTTTEVFDLITTMAKEASTVMTAYIKSGIPANQMIFKTLEVIYSSVSRSLNNINLLVRLAPGALKETNEGR